MEEDPRHPRHLPAFGEEDSGRGEMNREQTSGGAATNYKDIGWD